MQTGLARCQVVNAPQKQGADVPARASAAEASFDAIPGYEKQRQFLAWCRPKSTFWRSRLRASIVVRPRCDDRGAKHAIREVGRWRQVGAGQKRRDFRAV